MEADQSPVLVEDDQAGVEGAELCEVCLTLQDGGRHRAAPHQPLAAQLTQQAAGPCKVSVRLTRQQTNFLPLNSLRTV